MVELATDVRDVAAKRSRSRCGAARRGRPPARAGSRSRRPGRTPSAFRRRSRSPPTRATSSSSSTRASRPGARRSAGCTSTSGCPGPTSACARSRACCPGYRSCSRCRRIRPSSPARRRAWPRSRAEVLALAAARVGAAGLRLVRGVGGVRRALRPDRARRRLHALLVGHPAAPARSGRSRSARPTSPPPSSRPALSRPCCRRSARPCVEGAPPRGRPPRRLRPEPLGRLALRAARRADPSRRRAARRPSAELAAELLELVAPAARELGTDEAAATRSTRAAARATASSRSGASAASRPSRGRRRADARIAAVATRSETIQVSGIRCERCVMRLARRAAGHDGLEHANANLMGQVQLSGTTSDRSRRDPRRAAPRPAFARPNRSRAGRRRVGRNERPAAHAGLLRPRGSRGAAGQPARPRSVARPARRSSGRVVRPRSRPSGLARARSARRLPAVELAVLERRRVGRPAPCSPSAGRPAPRRPARAKTFGIACRVLRSVPRSTIRLSPSISTTCRACGRRWR